MEKVELKVVSKRVRDLMERLDEKSKSFYYVKFFSDGSGLLYNFENRCIAECDTEVELVEAIKEEIGKFGMCN